MSKQMIGWVKFNNFYREYCSGNYAHQRLGQAFVNCFKVRDRELFYCDDHDKCFKMITDQYMDDSFTGSTY